MFQGREGFVELGHLINISPKTQEKKAPQGNILTFFLLTQRWIQWCLFFHNQGTFFDFQKTVGEASHSTLVRHLWVWTNMHQYPWLFINTLEDNRINCSDYAKVLHMPDHLTCSAGFWRCRGSKCTRVLNMARLYMQGLHRVLTVNEYGSICLINTWIYLNVPKCLWTYWILLNVPEYAWINCFDYASVLDMPHHLRYLTKFLICLRH